LIRPFSIAVPAAAFTAFASIVSPWSIGIPPARPAQMFGFQSPACRLLVGALPAASILDPRLAVVAISVANARFGFNLVFAAAPRRRPASKT